MAAHTGCGCLARRAGLAKGGNGGNREPRAKETINEGEGRRGRGSRKRKAGGKGAGSQSRKTKEE